jgi:hypothetical protein
MSLQSQGLQASYLLTTESVKIVKGEKLGVLSAVLYLAPAKTSGRNVCPWSTPECEKLCLQTSGRMKFDSAQHARLARTEFFFTDRIGFKGLLLEEIDSLVRKAKRDRMEPMVRLNGTSDIPWESIFPGLFTRFPAVQFYDYTKSTARMEKYLAGGMPDNYQLTFSMSEENERDCVSFLARGGNVAIVFDGPPPAEWYGWPVVDGDDSDVRPWDPVPCVVGLRAKGKARNVESPFVLSAMV